MAQEDVVRLVVTEVQKEFAELENKIDDVKCSMDEGNDEFRKIQFKWELKQLLKQMKEQTETVTQLQRIQMNAYGNTPGGDTAGGDTYGNTPGGDTAGGGVAANVGNQKVEPTGDQKVDITPTGDTTV